MKNFNKNTRAALILGGVMVSSLVASPVFADENKSGNRNDFQKQMQSKWDHDEDDHNEDRDKKEHKEKSKFEDFKLNSVESEKIRLAIESKNYTAFKDALTLNKITPIPTEAEFNLLAEAYTKAKAGDIVGAQKILKDNNLSPLLNRFVMGKHLSLTDLQKSILKQAEDLIKQGKLEEAKKLLETAGLPAMPAKDITNIQNAEKIKTAIETSKTLRNQGKMEESKKVLVDAGVSDTVIAKIEKEFVKQEVKEKKSLRQIFKKFFKFGKEN